MEDLLLEVNNLKVVLNGHLILENISFSVKKGETLAIIGPNGAGKTALFRALLGLIPYSGGVKWKEGVKIGYVPQKLFIENDFPLTVREFFSIKEGMKYKIEKSLSQVGFKVGDGKKNILQRKIGVLSGGELQRVLIAFALLGEPEVLLFDEPTTGIDINAEETIYGLLHKLVDKDNLTILLISHELQVVYRYANNVICLNKQNICFGPPREVLDKESLAKIFGGDIGLYQHHT